MIAADTLISVTDGLAALYDTPGWAKSCATVLTGTRFCRAVAHGDSAEHVMLATLLSIRDGSVLWVGATHPARISGLLSLIEATAGRVGVAPHVQHAECGVNVWFIPVEVPS